MRLYILSAIFPFAFFAQTATFSADTTHLHVYTGHNQEEYNRVLEMEWKINGQSLHFGSKPIEIKPNLKKPLTIYFKQNKRAKWDTILCLVKEAKRYSFVYNECCGAFNVKEEKTDHFIKAKVVFEMAPALTGKKFFGTLDQDGILVPSTDTLVSACRSAMSPNIYTIGLDEIKICKDTTNCEWGICVQKKNQQEPDYYFAYKTISAKFKMLYMPLSEEPLKIIYDPKKNKTTLK